MKTPFLTSRSGFCAEPLFLTKYIEKAGTGTVDMLDRCRAAGMKQPEFCTDAGFFILTVWRKIPAIPSGPSQDQAGTKSAPATASVHRIVELLSVRGELGNAEILSAFELKSRRRLRETYLEPALRESLIEYMIPDKPTSSLQKYRLTEKGRAWLAGRKQ